MVRLSAVLVTTGSAYRVSVQNEYGLSSAGRGSVTVFPETEVCCICFDESGEKTAWSIKTFDDDASAEVQGSGFLDCRVDQGDGSSKCSAHCAVLGYEMKGCLKSAGMGEWRQNEFWSAVTTSGENSWSCQSDAEGASCGCPDGAAASLIEQEPVEEAEEATTTASVEDEAVVVGTEIEVCCLCLDEDGEKTAWTIKTFPDDYSADVQGAGFKDCRADQGDGTSKCSAHCDSIGSKMKGCEKSPSMNFWRQNEFWDKGFWTCSSDAEGASCGCPAGSAASLIEQEPVEEAEEAVEDETAVAVGTETEVCCLCLDEDGEKTAWHIKTFPDDYSADVQGAGFKDCRADQGDGTSKCSAHCDALGFMMKGCEKSPSMNFWRQNEFWEKGFWTCSSDAEGASCGCPAGAAASLIEQEPVEEAEEAVEDEAVAVGTETEVCCLCLDEDGEKTAWTIKTFDDDYSADVQGAGFKDCRADQGDGTSKCSAHCDSIGSKMKGCEKSPSMNFWRQNEFWDKGFWTCSSDAEGASCGCPAGSVASLIEQEPVEEAEEAVEEEAVVVGTEIEVCCLCLDEDGEKTAWHIKTFPDDYSAAVQGAGFKDCRADQGDGTSKCSAHCDALGFKMKGCEKSPSMDFWRQNEFWEKGFWTCSSDAEGASCGCPSVR